MLKQRGVKDVSQLSGGIHRYLETYGDTGFFRGKNFVFDQRVAQTPSELRIIDTATGKPVVDAVIDAKKKEDIVGKCIECRAPFDELCGSRVCTVCRDLVLVCETCQGDLREYHCARHASMKKCFFTFLEVFDRSELLAQKQELERLRDTYLPACQYKNVRRTVSRQIEKVSRRIQSLDTGAAAVDRLAPRRCRTCMETRDICSGRCWGFWKTDASAVASAVPSSKGTKRGGPVHNEEDAGSSRPTKPDPIAVGDRVEVGPDWNELRLGSKLDVHGKPRRGTVVEVKTWGAGSTELDCVAVYWDDSADDAADDDDQQGTRRKRRTATTQQQPLIYRWGVLALNQKCMYDVQLAVAAQD